MFEFWFSCSALEIPKTTQLLNDILFPVMLFVFIFWLMCEILVDGELASLEYPRWQIRDNSTSIGENLNDDVVTIRKVTTDENQHKTELFDIEQERKHLKALGVRKLQDFCKSYKIKGYATPCKQGGIDGLVEFLLQRQIYALHIEQQVKRVEISA
ncbi:MAG: hypothetical protein HC836_46795 [Richelia sp. RM2_1_2]|nr:hypothetical protein [Richelia sp. RM2_1_2]